LSQELRLPLVSKDSIREELFDRLGWKDRKWAQELGKALADSSSQVLDIGGVVIQVDTTDFAEVDYQGLLKSVKEVLKNHGEI
jgi:hypothetical protein